MPRPCLLLLFMVSGVLAATVPSPPVASAASDAEPAETREQIEALRERIERVEERLTAERRRRDRASEALARVEQRIGEIAGRLEALDERIRATGERLEELQARRAALQEDFAAHQRTLAAQLRAAYRMGRRPGLRLLLGQDDPAAASRALGYYAYFNEARVGAMERAERLVDELEAVTQETRAAEQSLRADREALASRRAELDQARAEREELLARLDRSIADDDARLKAMRQRRERLEGLLDDLDAALADTPAPLTEHPFASRSGELPWPIEGAPRTRFGADRAGGRLQWRGMIIAADMGETVRAVHHGRVVFADWLSGFGQLIILDHQDGHMTLYGFAERLLRSTGDWVAPGEPIATAGDSGGRDRPGLYFEIRRRGEPVDPLPWLAAR